MKRRTQPPRVVDTHNGLVAVESSGALGWFLALTSGLPRAGHISSRLELREGPNGEKWTRHLRPGRRNTAIFWERVHARKQPVEQLGPVRLYFNSTVDQGDTTLVLRRARIGPMPIPAALISIEASASRAHRDQLKTEVEMAIAGGRLGRLSYTSILLSP